MQGDIGEEFPCQLGALRTSMAGQSAATSGATECRIIAAMSDLVSLARANTASANRTRAFDLTPFSFLETASNFILIARSPNGNCRRTSLRKVYREDNEHGCDGGSLVRGLGRLRGERLQARNDDRRSPRGIQTRLRRRIRDRDRRRLFAGACRTFPFFESLLPSQRAVVYGHPQERIAPADVQIRS